MDDLIAENKGKTIEEMVKEEAAAGGPWLITKDELLAAGALDVPPSWRKSLGGNPRDLFSEMGGDDKEPDQPPAAGVEPES
jgi:hypothetical protein